MHKKHSDQQKVRKLKSKCNLPGNLIEKIKSSRIIRKFKEQEIHLHWMIGNKINKLEMSKKSISQ